MEVNPFPCFGCSPVNETGRQAEDGVGDHKPELGTDLALGAAPKLSGDLLADDELSKSDTVLLASASFGKKESKSKFVEEENRLQA